MTRGAARLLCALGAALAMAASAGAQDRGSRRGGTYGPYADVAAVIGAEIGFNQLAQDKGQWRAFRETAAPEAVMFVPARVPARTWLRGRPEPSTPLRWQPHAVWMSCDGTYAVTRGAWRQGARVGVFVTVWQRQRKGAGFRWVLDLGEPRTAMDDAPEMIAGKVAACPPSARPASPGPGKRRGRRDDDPPLPALADPSAAASPDGTLRWAVRLDPGGAGTLRVEARQPDGGFASVLDERFAAVGS